MPLSWPPRYFNASVSVLRNETLPPAAIVCYCKLRALAWGKSSLRASLADVLAATGLSRTRLLEYARLLRDSNALLWHCSNSAFEYSFTDDAAPGETDTTPEAAQIPENGIVPENGIAPIKKLDSDSSFDKESKAIGESRKTGLRPGKRDSAKPKAAPDPRSQHPAIQACRQAASRYPPTELYDSLISALGEQPDQPKLDACRREWVERGYNRASWKWAAEWYVSGIPQRKNGTHHATTRRDAPTGSPKAETVREVSSYRVDPDLPADNSSGG